jgi:hypothetical protein
MMHNSFSNSFIVNIGGVITSVSATGHKFHGLNPGRGDASLRAKDSEGKLSSHPV